MYSDRSENESGGDECVMKIWGAGKGFKGFAQLMTHHLNTHR